MFDSAGDDFEIYPGNEPPSRAGGAGILALIFIPVLAVLAWCFVVFICMIASAHAQQTPQTPSEATFYKSVVAARLLVKSDSTILTATRGIFIGDAAACTAAFRFNWDTAAVTFATLQPGVYYPFSIVQLMSTNTACTTVIALY